MTPTFEQAIEIVKNLSSDDRNKLLEFLRAKESKNYQEILMRREKARLAQLAKDKARYRPRIEWIRENANNYQGEWLAFRENVLFAHGTDKEKVCEEAYAKGASMISLCRIGEDKRSSFGNW